MDITKIKIGNEDYFIQDTITGYTSIGVTTNFPSGVEVGKITFNNVTYTLYAPTAEITTTLDIQVNNNSTNLAFIQS